MAKTTKKGTEIPDFDKNATTDIPGKITGNDVKEIAFLKNEQAQKVFGFLLLVFTTVLFISFVSFFFSWKTDQDLVSGAGDWEQYKSQAGDVGNAMGLLGARLSYWFVHNGFGIGAFAMLPWLALCGMHLLFNYRPFSLLRIAIHTVLFTVWFSLFLGFLFQTVQSLQILGGTFGYFGVQKLNHSIGGIGTFFLLLVYAVVYSIVFLNLNPFSRIKLPQKKQTTPEIVTDTVPAGVETAPNIIVDGHVDEIEEDPEPEVDIADLPPIVLKKKEEPVIEEPVKEIDLDTHFETAQIIEPEQELETDEAFVIEDHTKAEEELLSENQGEALPERFGLDTVYDPTAELSKYKFPTLDLLTDYGSTKQEIDMGEIESSKNMIIETLKNYNIGISKIKASVGPTVTLYEIVPAPGVKISKIKNLEDDIALSLAALGIRIIAPIPGKGTIGIEVPNKNPEMVPMKTVLASKKFQECDYQLPVALGKTISNEIFVADLAKMPHLLMAGATGQGKSVGLNAILVSLIYKKHPAYIKFVLVDPKKVELTLYNKIERHFLAKLPGDGEAIITDNTKVINTLNSLCVEMDNRYKLLQDAMVRNIVEYNAKFLARKLNPELGHRFLPYIVVVIDEVADLIMTAGKEIETPIARIAQLARAIGIHLILATQRPSVNVITGMIKANFPARIAFRVTSKIDSRTILDSNGADQLIGKGDMLYSGGNEIIRLQCPFVDTPEVDRIVDFVGEQRAYPTAYILPEVKEDGVGGNGEGFDPNERDELFEDAARIVVLNQVGSTSLIQRKLKIGYNRAGRLMDQLEDAGVVGPNQGSKARQVLLPDEYSLEQFLNNM
ncbi:MAG: DNA translocase FtsK 4TM domain-containing protein [Bacteroidia bacterium]|nr:DNA translocase FtsK 4TM domain-containing protein [Bacteroidia bacterium]